MYVKYVYIRLQAAYVSNAWTLLMYCVLPEHAKQNKERKVRYWSITVCRWCREKEKAERTDPDLFLLFECLQLIPIIFIHVSEFGHALFITVFFLPVFIINCYYHEGFADVQWHIWHFCEAVGNANPYRTFFFFKQSLWFLFE